MWKGLGSFVGAGRLSCCGSSSTRMRQADAARDAAESGLGWRDLWWDPGNGRGERGIRTLGRGLALRRFSKALLSTTQPSLLVALCFRQLLPTDGRQRVQLMPTK